MIKDKFLKLIYDKLNNFKLNNLYLGVLIKAIHFYLPLICFYIIVFYSKIIAFVSLVFVTFVCILYYYFNNCFITIIENELLKDYDELKDLNVIDPVLNILDLQINNKNRKYISIYLFMFYYSTIMIIFVFRFFF